MVVVVAVLASSAAGAAFAGTPYTLTDLGVTSTSEIGYIDTYDGQPVVVNGGGWYWTKTGGAVNLLPLLPSSWGAISCTAAGVNSSGQIDGWYDTNTAGAGGAFVYTIGGSAEQINLPGNNAGGVEGVGNINESGRVPLYYAAAPAVFNANTQAVTYPGGAGISGTGYGVMPSVINASGWVAGTNLGASPAAAEVWNGSTWNTVPPYGTGANYAYGIDSYGDIVGKAISSGYRAFYAPYNSGTGTWGAATDLFTGTTKGAASAINDNQVIVGFNQTAGAADIWNTPTAGSGVALSTLVTPSSLSTWTLAEATGINDAAEIVGFGTNPAGTAGRGFSAHARIARRCQPGRPGGRQRLDHRAGALRPEQRDDLVHRRLQRRRKGRCQRLDHRAEPFRPDCRIVPRDGRRARTGKRPALGRGRRWPAGLRLAAVETIVPYVQSSQAGACVMFLALDRQFVGESSGQSRGVARD